MTRQESGRKNLNRRDFIKLGGMSTVALTLGSAGLMGMNPTASFAKSNGNPNKGQNSFSGFGPLVKDPGGVIDLPKGFQYRIISEEGKRMTNGAPIPGDFDGMAAFQGPGHLTILVRNHELSGSESAVPGKNPYNRQAPGGTTALVIGPDRRLFSEYVTSSGSLQNCAGGPTPWGTWLTCEENRTDDHGYVFEVMPNEPENNLSKTPIRDMGFFSHEATAIDPATGIVYLTEDDFRGKIDPDDPTNDERSSFLYRYIPNDTSKRPGALQKGGKLQAMAIEEKKNPDADFMNPGQRFGVVWKDVNKEEPHDDALTNGCVRFNRLEGAYFAGGVFWFDDTAGGEKRLGQIYRYIPATETLELFYEGTEANEMESPDNICITPWGDLLFAEDGGNGNRVMGITPEGEVYPFANNRLNGSEFCGPTFSPDGKTFFLNIQSPGITFAIWGPFPGRNPARQRYMGHAAPPANFAPKISAHSQEIAKVNGISDLEAAAFLRHGVPLKL
ncbi:alkaline phosphatase PhoX [Rossellomorea sp. BNER]|uniref:alkaline phosphatase PhoX n=1 Tax=Rossellomorea sp. BNER TaxID=2962031 RepID=UPI003AF2C355|nr:PhoX family protein [Rossellomorea sp. BNER]